MKKFLCMIFAICLMMTCSSNAFAEYSGLRKRSTLEVTEATYIFKYTLFMTEAGCEPNIERVDTGSKDLSSYMLSDFSSIMFQFKDGKISEAMMLCSGDGTMASGAEIMLSMAASIVVFDPSLDTADKALDALMKAIEKGSYTTAYCQYTYTQSEYFGTMLTIIP